ncbi:uncharacterized protein A4U43_C08F24450 [Asparagus officinalis]|nr:uncharacterized protein A4U43_C08F24450 [Asparagus officinalis]
MQSRSKPGVFILVNLGSEVVDASSDVVYIVDVVLMKTEVTWVRDMLHGDDAYALRVKLLQQVPEEYPYKDDE